MDTSSKLLVLAGLCVAVALAVFSPIRINVSFLFNDDDEEPLEAIIQQRHHLASSVGVCGDVYVVVESMPELVGGLEGIQSRLVYPEKSKAAGEEGRVFVQFLVDKGGNVKDPVIIRGVSPTLNEEALRVVRDVKFVPGKQRGESVCVKMTLPIKFELA